MKNLIRLLVLVVMGITISCSTSNEKKLIVIDAGHGGVDKGVVIGNVVEKDLNIALAERIQSLNTNKNLEIILLRDQDQFIALEDRVAQINELKPDLMISLHHNSSNKPSENGVEIFISKDNAVYDISKKKAKEMLKALPVELNKRGVKESGFMIVKKSNCPAMLIEVGFLTNKHDRDYLLSDKGMDEVAQSILGEISK